jgi:hypothetical protein
MPTETATQKPQPRLLTFVMLCPGLSGRDGNKRREGREYEKATVGGLPEEEKPHDA